MKNQNLKITVLALLTMSLLLSIGSCVIAQNQMDIKCTLLKDGVKQSRNNPFTITVIGSDLKSEVIQTNDNFRYKLDYNKEYTILFQYKGCQPKSIYFNNHTNDYQNLTCYFTIDLKSSNSDEILKVAEVYYNSNKLDFEYKITKDYKASQTYGL